MLTEVLVEEPEEHTHVAQANLSLHLIKLLAGLGAIELNALLLVFHQLLILLQLDIFHAILLLFDQGGHIDMEV